LENLLEEAKTAGARVWLLDCDFTTGGPWAGLHEFFSDILSELRESRPDMVAKHDYELVHVLPELQREIRVRNPSLTDLSPPEEKVRNYPADRAFRILHGLIELLDHWKGADERPWVIACDHFDQVSYIGRRFFRELMRRRGERLRLALVAAVSFDSALNLLEALGEERIYRTVQVDLPMEEREHPEADLVSSQIALELDDFAAEDRLRIQIHLPQMIRYARLGQRHDLLSKWYFFGLEVYNTLGLYEDARVYGEKIRTALRGKEGPEYVTVRWAMFLKLMMCYMGLGEAEEAHRLAKEEALGRIHEPEWLSQLCYLMAMLHARYLPERDLAKAEGYLEEGLQALDNTKIPNDRIHFQHAFNRNGLAMVRHFQGRYEEAIEFCRACQEHLDLHLSQDRHRLHRSVLFYNQAQVYVALGNLDKAVEYYSAAMVIDPNYSEYYNERGSVYLRSGRLKEALADYRQAIELSPPYFESFTNLGQCLRQLRSMEEAEEAYSRALDLAPDRVLPWVGRAQSREALGRIEEAIADYDTALVLDPEQWQVVANRGVLHYELRHLSSCLADFERAIELAPGEPDLYHNRAVALDELGRAEEAVRDLHTYLRLKPEAEDRTEALNRLKRLEPKLNAAAAA